MAFHKISCQPRTLIPAIFLILFPAISLRAQDVQPAPSGAVSMGTPSARQTTAPGNYVLGPGDEVTIRATNAPDISDRPVRLDQNGVINMPTIGRLHAGGL